MALICNFDKTCLLLDGSTINRGGRPEALIYDPGFPLVGKATCKSLLTSTLITGSTAAGEALVPGEDLVPHMLALKKQELEAAMDKFNLEERDAMQQILDVIDGEDAIASLEGELEALGAEVTASTDGQIGAV